MISNEQNNNNLIDDYKRHLAQISTLLPRNENTALLDIKFIMIDDRQVQLLMRDIDSETIAKALTGSGGIIQLKFFKNMGNRGAAILFEEIKLFQILSDEEIVIAQKILLRQYEKLEQKDLIKVSK